MKHNVLAAIFSTLAILLLMFHLSDEVSRGMEPGGLTNVNGIGILVLWLIGVRLMLAERRLGYVIVLLGSLLGSLVPVLHMTGTGLVGRRIANTPGIFFWVWTNMALGVTAAFSLILSARGLWTLVLLRKRRDALPSR